MVKYGNNPGPPVTDSPVGAIKNKPNFMKRPRFIAVTSHH